MNFSHEIFGNVAVVHAPDELTEGQVPALMDTCDRLGFAHIVLELDSTEVMDSAGLTALLDLDDSLVAKGGGLKLATSNAINRQILRLTKIDQRIQVFDSLVDAVKSFRWTVQENV